MEVKGADVASNENDINALEFVFCFLFSSTLYTLYRISLLHGHHVAIICSTMPSCFSPLEWEGINTFNISSLFRIILPGKLSVRFFYTKLTNVHRLSLIVSPGDGIPRLF